MGLAFNLFGNIGLRTNDLEAGARKAKAELAQLNQAAQAQSTSFAAMGRALGGLAAGVVSLAALKSGLEGIVRTGVDMERLRASFIAIAGSAQQGRQEFAFVSQTANRLGFDVQALAEQYRSLMAATRGTTLAGQDTQNLFVSLSQASRAYGLSTEQTGRALTAFQQIISKGKVSQEELRGQLSEALPGASQIAARAFGVTTQELDKLIEKGVDAAEFTRKFTTQLQREAPAATDQAGAGFVRLGNEILALKDRLAQSGLLKFFNDLAAAGARALEAQRVPAEARTEQARLRALHGIGAIGEDFSKLLPENQQRVLAITEQIMAAEARLLEFQRMPSVLGAARATRAQAEIDLLRQQQTELLALIKLQELQRRDEQQRVELPMGPGAGFLEARKKEQELQLAREKERIDIRKGEIDIRREADEEAQRKAKQLAEQRTREEEQSNAQAAQQRVQLFRQTQESQQAILDGLQREIDQQTLSTELLRRKVVLEGLVDPLLRQEGERRLAIIEQLEREKAIEEELRPLRQERWKDLDIFGLNLLPSQEQALKRDQEIVERLRLAVAQAEAPREERPEIRFRASMQEIEGIAKRHEAEMLLLRFTAAREATAQFEQETRIAAQLADNLLDTFTALATGSEVSFSRIAESFTRMVMQMLIEASGLKQQLTELIRKLIQSGIGLLGASAGGASFTTSGTTAVAGDIATSEAIITGAGLQQGGPMMPNRFYTVGERGPELVWSGAMGGHVFNQQQAGGLRPINIVMNIATRDAQSFQRSDAEIRYKLGQAIRQAQRDV